MKYLFFFFLLAGLLFTSCNKNDDTVTATGDVYIVSQKVAGNTVYGLFLHVYSFSAIKTATASSSGTNYPLQAYPDYNNDFYYQTPVSEMTATKPAAGKYTFQVVMQNGQTLTSDDQLYDTVIDPVVITKNEYDKTLSKAVINWTAVTGADWYVVKLYNNDNLVYVTRAIASTQTPNMNILQSDGFWINSYVPVAGTTYRLMVSAYKFETNVTSTLDIQASSQAESTLVWNPLP